MIDRNRFHSVYGAPLIHLTLILAMWIGVFVPPLRFLALLGGVLTLIDLPFVTFGAIALSFHYPLLAIIWQVVAGTLWWYLLSWLFFKFRNRKVQGVLQS